MPQLIDFSEFYQILGSEIALESHKNYFLFLLGTQGKFTAKPTAPERIYERGDTLSYLAQVIATLFNEQEAVEKKLPCSSLSFSRPSVDVMDGPSTMGSDVGQLIAIALFLILRAIALGKTALYLSGHSRGAVETILVIHELDRIKKALIDHPEKSFWDIFIDSPCRLTRDAIPKLFSNGSTGDSKEHRALLLKHLNAIKIHTFLIDPVPGDKTYAPGVGWYDTRFYQSITCHHYELLICRDERSSFFYPIIPKDMRPTIIPGHHGTPIGNLYCQQYIDIPAELKHLKSTHVQDLVICKFFNFIDQKAELLTPPVEPIQLGHADLDVVTNAYLKADASERKKIMLDLYLEIAKNDDLYRYFTQTHYPYLYRDYALGNHRYIHYQNPDYVSMDHVLPDINSGFVNAEHALLYLGNYVDFSKNESEEVDVQIFAITCTLKNIIMEMKGVSQDKPLLTIISHDPGRDIFFKSLATLVSTIGKKYINQHLGVEERKRLSIVIKAPFHTLETAKIDDGLSSFKSIIEQFETVLQHGLIQTLENHYESLIQESKLLQKQIYLFLDPTERFSRIYRNFVEHIPISGEYSEILTGIQYQLKIINPSDILNIQDIILKIREQIYQNPYSEADKEKIQSCIFKEDYAPIQEYFDAYQCSSEQYLSKTELLHTKLDDLQQSYTSLKHLVGSKPLHIDGDNLRSEAKNMLELATKLIMDKNQCLHNKINVIGSDFYRIVKKQAIGFDYLLHDITANQYRYGTKPLSTLPHPEAPFSCLCGKTFLFFSPQPQIAQEKTKEPELSSATQSLNG